MDLQTVRQILLRLDTSGSEDEAIDVAIEAIDFRIGKKPYHISPIPFSVILAGKCPECGNVVRNDQNYCEWCGLKLNWEDENDG